MTANSCPDRAIVVSAPPPDPRAVRWRIIHRDRQTSSTPYLDAMETVARGAEGVFRA